MTILRDKRITESSGLAQSSIWPSIAYTLNDEPGAIFAVDTATGRTVGTTTIDHVLRDGESVRMDASDGKLAIADIGDNKAKRHDCALYVLDEPGPGHHTHLPTARIPVAYSDGPRNAEALAIHPARGWFILSKEKRGHAYRWEGGHWRLVATGLPKLITDATFTVSGNYLLIRCKGKRPILVLDEHWRVVAKIPAPRLKQGESITVTYDGTAALIGSEGVHSPLFRVPIPEAYR